MKSTIRKLDGKLWIVYHHQRDKIREGKVRIMKKKLGIILIFIICLSTSAVFAFDMAFYGVETKTKVSGYPGNEIILDVFQAEERNYDGDDLRPTMHTTGLKGLYWKESSAMPCYIKIYQGDLKTGKKKFDYLEINICKDSKSRSRYVKLRKKRHFVRALEVCTAKNEGAGVSVLKGIRVYPAEVTKKGNVIKVDESREDTHEDCSQWHERAECPDEEIAVSVKIHRQHDYITGLGLGCRPVKRIK